MTPTKEQVKAVWDAIPDPSSRVVAGLLKAKGLIVSYRTVARWKDQDWRDPVKMGARPLREKAEDKPGLKAFIQAEVAKIPAATVKEADTIVAAGGLEAAIDGGKLTDVDYKRIDERVKELSKKTPAQLVELQDKARTVMNIVLMEEATRRAHVMVLMPKDTGSFVADAAEASKVSAVIAPIEPVGNGNDAKLIESRPNATNPLSDAIRRVREKVA